MHGRVLVGVGAFLVLLMAAVAWIVVPMMLRPGEMVGGTTFAGTAFQGRIFLGVIALVGLSGAVCVANGAWMATTGRRSPAFTFLFAILLLLLAGLAWAIRRGLV